MNPIDLRMIDETDGLVRLELIGRLSHDGWTVGFDPIVDICGDAIYDRKVLINLARTTYIDSSGVSWLLESNKRFKNHGGIMVLHSATPLTAQFFRLMRMELALNIEPNEAAARQKANGHEHSGTTETPAAEG